MFKLRYGKIITFMIVITIAIVMGILGFWQLFRLNYKNEIIENINNTINNNPKQISIMQDVSNYSKIEITGHFISTDNYIYLYRRIPKAHNKNGYYVFQPFKTEKGDIIMVARGWISSENKYKVSSILKPQNKVIGITLPSEKESIFIPANDIENNVWFTLVLDDVAKYLQIDNMVTDKYLLQINPEYLADGVISIPIDNLTRIRNNHLEYAITWFALSISCLIIFYISLKSKKQKSSANNHP